jgi:FHS family L-fucose permease-like MFS transporter
VSSHTSVLASLGALYFIFGFITCLNDILVPHLRGVFELGYARAMLVQCSFFTAYFLLSVPSGSLVDRYGFRRGMVGGLLLAAIGCLLFLPAAEGRSYPLFLLALFVLAGGITLLQVAANPYVAILGRPEGSSSRLTLTQGFNSLGTTLAPLVGSVLILGGAGATAVRMPYLVLAGVLLVLAGVTALLRMPEAGPGIQAEAAVDPRLRPRLLLGALAIFLYVGAEVAIGSFLVNYINQPEIAGIPLAASARFVSIYWGGAMVGRFLGAGVMRVLPPGRVLAFNATMAAALVLTALATRGGISMWAILSVGFFNSIMFPTIFTLAIQGQGGNHGRASGILCMAIVGGALVPVLQGAVVDALGLRAAFLLPVFCYAYIAFYGAKGHGLNFIRRFS